MKFGVNILNFGPGATPESIRRWAHFAEDAGYHLIMISDHVAVTPDVQALFPAPFYDPFISLAWLAGITTKVELGTTVTILPYRHPLLTARMAADIDQLCGGRFIFGCGVGSAKQEFEALGLPFNRRGAMASEYLEAIRSFWSSDVATYEGRFISFKDVHTAPRPLRPAGPPIWVGGSSEAALRRAVLYGDAWHPYRFRVDTLRENALPKLREIAAAEGKPVPALCPRLMLRLTTSSLSESRRLAGHGTIEQIRSDLEALAVLGAEYVLFDTFDGKPEQTLHPEKDWAMLATLAEQLLDLDRGSLRHG
jgi:probable F420-dependent oxidoreductase